MRTTETVYDRVMSRSTLQDGPMRTQCRVWAGALDGSGYGSIRVSGCVTITHREIWQHFNGPIPPNLCVLHRCDVRACVNIKHLFLGTNAENVADRVSKGRSARGDRHGSRLHPESRPRGEQNGRATITDEQAVEILHAYQRGDTSHRELATKYDIGATTVYRIVNRTERFAWLAVNSAGESVFGGVQCQ